MYYTSEVMRREYWEFRFSNGQWLNCILPRINTIPKIPKKFYFFQKSDTFLEIFKKGGLVRASEFNPRQNVHNMLRKLVYSVS